MDSTNSLLQSQQPTLSIFQEDLAMETSLSFVPFLDYLKEKAAVSGEANPALSEIILQFEKIPGIHQPIKDISTHPESKRIIQLMETAIFSPIEDAPAQLFAFSVPWHFYPFHASTPFREVVYHDIILSDETAFKKFRREKLERLYRHILQHFYNLHIEGGDEFTYPIRDGKTGMVRYFKMHLDMRFCRVLSKGPLPSIDKKFMEANFHSVCADHEFSQEFIVRHFALEGFTVARISEVTETEAVNSLKNVLLESFEKSPQEHFNSIHSIIQSLLGIGGVNVSLIPFPKINNRLALEDHHGADSYIFRALETDKNDRLFLELEKYFLDTCQKLILPSVSEEDRQRFSFLSALDLPPGSGYVLIPMIKRDHLLGVVEVSADKPGLLTKQALHRLRPAHVIVIQLLSNYLHQFSTRIEKLIKENFTSLQPSVEWKFRETIHEFLKARRDNPKAEIGKLVFEDVYPFYGAVDIRESSAHRSASTEYDLREQLQRISSMLQEAISKVDLPILRELHFRSGEWIMRISEQLTTEDELQLMDFIDRELAEALSSVHTAFPSVRPLINAYFDTTVDNTGSYYTHRRKYEQTIQQINSTLNRYLEACNAALQPFYPYYFEKYKTDGVEYNIYMGQALLPGTNFSSAHQKNLYLWQIRSMIDMAVLTHQLLPTLPLPLQTTQLILVYNVPVTISFRRDERKFDVDGAYNIRYEIVKKRIDKVCLKNSDERLTQPGKLAIIYSYQKDIDLFEIYIDLLIRDGLLLPEKEYLDLQELQGVTGLKALRVGIRFPE
jgi:hypothetical protein